MFNINKIIKTFVIAEIGVNHNSDMKIAKKIILECKKMGVDAVKFQTFQAETLAKKDTPKVNYQKENNKDKEGHFDMLKKLELSKKDHLILIKYCKKINIRFISTPYDLDSAKYLNKIGISIFKVASADLTDLFLHTYLAKIKKPVIISTGMSTFDQVNETLKIYKKFKNNNIALLHCVSNYPCAFSSINLRCLNEFKKRYKNVVLGFSDHTTDPTASLLSLAMGCKIIEKHVTLNKKFKGPDHKASADINDFKKLVKYIRKSEIILGNSIKKVQKEEKEMLSISRKSLYYKNNFKKGKKINNDDVVILRPNKGILPIDFFKIKDKCLKVNVKSLYPVKIEHFKI